MDLSLIAAAGSALSAAREIGKAASGIRDFNQLAVTVANLNEQILKAQDSLFAHNASLLALQQEAFESREELRKAKEALSERDKYAPFEIAPHVFVLRLRAYIAPDRAAAECEPVTEPDHYICQPCLSIRGNKIILAKANVWGTEVFTCPACKAEFTGMHVGV